MEGGHLGALEGAAGLRPATGATQCRLSTSLRLSEATRSSCHPRRSTGLVRRAMGRLAVSAAQVPVAGGGVPLAPVWPRRGSHQLPI